MPPSGRSTFRVCILIPGQANQFNNLTGFRLEEALNSLGAKVRVTTPTAWTETGTDDWALFINLAELVFAAPDRQAIHGRLKAILRTCRHSANWLLDSVATRWYRLSVEMVERLGVEEVHDYSLHSQLTYLPPREQARYRHVRYGLTARERAAVPPERWDESSRPVPWCVIGHRTPARVALVERLVRGYCPSGFAYLPELAPFTEDGPHLSDAQVQRVLERSRLHLWCSHFAGFYLEAERFRRALLAGCLPVKVLSTPLPDLPGLPFSYLLVPEANLETWLATADLPALWARFRADYLAYPTLAAELAAVLNVPSVPELQPRQAA
jgi:hypothetical protein